jgi:hypothetical protein
VNISTDGAFIVVHKDEYDSMSNAESFFRELLDWAIQRNSDSVMVSKTQDSEIVRSGKNYQHKQYKVAMRTNTIIDLDPDEVV